MDMDAERYRIEHWRYDDVTLLAVVDGAAAAGYIAAYRAAHMPGTLVVRRVDGGAIVARCSAWSGGDIPAPGAVRRGPLTAIDPAKPALPRSA